jgi:hypothetical protein
MPAFRYRSRKFGTRFHRTLADLERDIRFQYNRRSIWSAIQGLKQSDSIAVQSDGRGYWITLKTEQKPCEPESQNCDSRYKENARASEEKKTAEEGEHARTPNNNSETPKADAPDVVVECARENVPAESKTISPEAVVQVAELLRKRGVTHSVAEQLAHKYDVQRCWTRLQREMSTATTAPDRLKAENRRLKRKLEK